MFNIIGNVQHTIEWTDKDLKHFSKHLFKRGGANLSKI